MKIFYTNHAKDKLKRRKIEKIWVEETIKYPDYYIKVKHKHNAIKKLNGRTLKVVYVKEKHIKIITLFFVK